MKYFLFLIIIYPQIVSAEWVCPAPAGCKIVLDTGECIGCIEVKEPPIIKEEKVVEKKPVVKVSKPPLYPRVNESLGKTNKKKGVCYVEPCDWLNKKKPVVKTKPTKPKSWKGTLFKCVVGCRYAWWDSEGNNYDEDGNLVLNTVPKKSSTNTKKKFRNEKGLWMCWEPEFGWLDFKTGKPLGEYRECGWRDRGSRTADAIERGIKECGGYMDWVWLDEHHSKYRCI